MDGELKDLIYAIYARVLQTTNKILHNCKTFSISILQLEDPSYEQMAEQLEEAATIIWTICDDYPNDAEEYHAAVKSAEYATNVKDIAKAIRRGDEETLNRLVTELDRRPFI